MSYRCLVYLVKDGEAIKRKFEKDFRDAQIAGRRGVVAVFKASRISEVIPHIRDALLNNIVMGVTLITIEDMKRDGALRVLRNELSKRRVADAKIVYEDRYAEEANHVLNALKALSIPVTMEKV